MSKSLRPLLDIVNPEPTEDQLASVDPCGDFFDFQDALPNPLEHDELVDANIDDKSPEDGVLFFSVVELKPGGMIVPDFAPQVSGHDSLAVVKHNVVGCNLESSVFYLNLEEHSLNDTSNAVFVLTPSLFSIHDSDNILQWRLSADLSYDFGLKVPLGLSASVERASVSLVDAKRDDVLLEVEKGSSSIDALQFLADSGVAVCCQNSEMSTFWRLDDHAESKLTLCNRISDFRSIVMPRKDVLLAELSVIELHSYLRMEGWQCLVKESSRKKKYQAQVMQPIDYVVGNDKFWWISQSQTTFRAPYFVALLSAAQHGFPVSHFRTNEYYDDLVAGKGPPKPAKRATTKRSFQFDVVVHPSCLPRQPVKRARKTQAAPTKSKATVPTVAKKDCSSGRDNIMSLNRAVFGSDCSDSDTDKSQKEASESVESDSQAESWTSSSDISTAPPGIIVDAAPVMIVEADASVVSNSSKQVASKTVVASTRAYRLETTFYWLRDLFRFTQISDARGNHIGWEVACPHPGHKGSVGTTCRKTMRFNANGGIDQTERVLKWWCMNCIEFDTRGQHRDGVSSNTFPGLANLPSLEALELQAEAKGKGIRGHLGLLGLSASKAF